MKKVSIEYLPAGRRRASFQGAVLAEAGPGDDVFHNACVALKAKGLTGGVQFLSSSNRVIRKMMIEEGALQREYSSSRRRRSFYYPDGYTVYRADDDKGE